MGLILFFCSESVPSCLKQDFLFQEAECSYQKDQEMFLDQKEDALFDDFPEMLVIEQNSFKQTAPASIYEGKVLGAIVSDAFQRRDIFDYTVEKGDTLSSIAEKFGLSLNTILWTNDLSSRSTISPGQKLTILPADGFTHLVRKGETASELAQYYQSDLNELIEVNDLSNEGEVFAGDLIIIPGGKKPIKTVSSYNAPLASSYFICPIPSPCTVSQGLHWYNAIDFSHGKCGEPVFASAGGQIQRIGYHGTAGNFVQILHSNGVTTFYGHLSKILAISGQQVSQGAIIGYVGNTGYTIGATGCHVHFEVRGARNPFAY